MQIHIPKEAEAKLKQLAQDAGFGDNIEQYVLERSLGPLENEAPQRLSRAEWKARLDAFVSRHPKHDHFVDVSRESIYEGRGE